MFIYNSYKLTYLYELAFSAASLRKENSFKTLNRFLLHAYGVFCGLKPNSNNPLTVVSLPHVGDGQADPTPTTPQGSLLAATLFPSPRFCSR